MPPPNDSPTVTPNSEATPASGQTPQPTAAEPTPMPNLPPPETWPEQVKARVANALAGLGIAGQAVGIANTRQLLADANARVRDAHRLGAKALGVEDTVQEADPMGEIQIIGEVHNTHTNQPPTVSPLASTPIAAAGGWLLTKLLPLALTAGLGGGAGYVAHQLLGPAAQEAPAPAQPGFDPTKWKLEFPK